MNFVVTVREEEEKTEELHQCRICMEEEVCEDELVAPCTCSGTQQWVHPDCLRTWRRQFQKMHLHRSVCPVCRTFYTVPVDGFAPAAAVENNGNNARRNAVLRRIQHRRRHKYYALIRLFLYTVMIFVCLYSFMDYFADNSLYTYSANDTKIKTLLLYKVQIVNAGVYTIFYTYYSTDMLHFLSAGCLISMIVYWQPYFIYLFNLVYFTGNMVITGVNLMPLVR